MTWEKLVEETLAFGSPETVTRHIAHMRDLGVGHILCWMNFGGLPQDKIRRSMELFATEVMPHFRDSVAPASWELTPHRLSRLASPLYLAGATRAQAEGKGRSSSGSIT